MDPQLIESIHYRNWKRHKKAELVFWEKWIASKGWEWPDDFEKRTNPEMPVDPILSELFPKKQKQLSILDVGAGPLTCLGKVLPGRQTGLSISAIDAFADEYDALLAKYGIKPLVRTQKVEAEHMRTIFPANSFDLVFSRNALDHMYDPFSTLLNMLAVVKQDHYVFLTHKTNLAHRQEYTTLAQWNMSAENGDWIIWNEYRRINITREIRHSCSVQVIGNDEWVDVLIKKTNPKP